MTFECYAMIFRHCSVMILPFLPALEPRLDLFVIIHHPFPLSLCIIPIILRVSTWLNLIHLTKKKKSHHWTEINQLPTARLTYPLLQASHKARKRSLSEDKCGNIDCVRRNILQVMIRHFHNAQSSERTISEGRSLSGGSYNTSSLIKDICSLSSNSTLSALLCIVSYASCTLNAVSHTQNTHSWGCSLN